MRPPRQLRAPAGPRLDAPFRSDAVATLEGARPAGALQGKALLVLEGFSILNYKPLLELCDLRYYLVLEAGECQARRALRLYDPPDVPGYFERCVWPEHLRYRAEVRSSHSRLFKTP